MQTKKKHSSPDVNETIFYLRKLVDTATSRIYSLNFFKIFVRLMKYSTKTNAIKY